MLLTISGAVNFTAYIVVGVLMNCYDAENSIVNGVVVTLIGVSSFFFFSSWL